MNIKLILILGIIILFYIYLVIKKQNIIVYNLQKTLSNKVLKNNIEYFYSVDYKPKFDTAKIKNFLTSIGLISNNETIPSFISKKEIVILTKELEPSGIVFDKSNDDIIVFDKAYLKRFQLRIDRNELYKKANINLNLKEINNFLDDNVFLFCIYIEKIVNLKDIIDDTQDDMAKLKTLKNTENIKINEKIKDYKDKILNNINDNSLENLYQRKSVTEFHPIFIISGLYEYYDGTTIKYRKNIIKYEWKDKEKLVTDLKRLNYICEEYLNINKCFDPVDNTKCMIDYDYNLPSYIVDEKKKLYGLQNLNFDYDSDTLNHTYMLDDKIKHINDNMGVFQPFISNDKIKGDTTKKYNIETVYNYKGPESKKLTVNSVTTNTINENNIITNTDGKYNLGYPIIKDKISYSFIENTGIGMYYEHNSKCVFVPDPFNNRIQVMKCHPERFTYNGEFGNVSNITKRALPYYQVKDKNEDTITYEPIINTSLKDNKKIRETLGYRCYDYKTKWDKSELYFRNFGPLDMFNIKTPMNKKDILNDQIDISNIPYNSDFEINIGFKEDTHNYECDVDLSTRRANIHTRQYKHKTSATDSLKYFKKGHFYHLLEECNRVLGIGANPKKNNIYLNPHLINVDVKLNIKDSNGGNQKINIENNPISEGSLAYRKILLKYITETDIGQEFGQLFRPQAIFYDDDTKDKGGHKYYIVDTYHHCIQCFEKVENLKTSKGEVFNFKSVDEEFNKKKGYYVYNVNWKSPNYKDYSESNIHSLGVRQSIIEYDNRMLNQPPYLDNEWAKKYGQTDENNEGTVKLYRWTSGITSKKHIISEKYNVPEYPFFYSELSESNKTYPGTGEFSFPTDILIMKSPLIDTNKFTYKTNNYKENFLFITDMGNNRVSIFKKNRNKLGKYRFRFYKFLEDTGNKLINPISITKDKYDNLYILTLQTENNNIIYKSELDKTKIDELVFKEPTVINSVKKSKKIRIDDRGLMAITGTGDKKIIINLELVSDNVNVRNKIKDETKIETYNGSLGIKFKLEFPFDNNLFIERYRLVIKRTNLSKLNKKGSIIVSKNELLISSEYKYDKKDNNNKIVFIDEFNKTSDYENYWTKNTHGIIEKIENDLIGNREANSFYNSVIVSNKLNTNIDKKYRKIKYKFKDEEITNNVLEGVEDYVGYNLMPNSSYNYSLFLTDYSNQIDLPPKSSINLNTFPLGIPTDVIYKTNVPKNGGVSNDINLNINYGAVSNLHMETMKYNPLSLYILKGKHNRSKDITNKYINMDKGQMIQLLMPKGSKYIHTKFSRPKFGKLYIKNVYNFGEVREVMEEMEEGKLYAESNLIIYYSAEGGEFPIPKGGGDMKYIDDYFILGDNPMTIYTKIKFRVRIYLNFENDSIIEFQDPKNIIKNISYYNRERGINDSLTLTKLDNKIEHELWKKIGADKGADKYEYITKEINDTNIEQNQTYEYHVFVGNHKIINNGINTFYYTTKPEKIVKSNMGASFERLMSNDGKLKSYIKLTWKCSKTTGIYWSYNFLIMRKQIKHYDKQEAKQKSREEKLEFKNEMDNFITLENGSIILKKKSTKEEENTFKKTIELGESGKYRITFSPFKAPPYNSKDIKITIFDNNVKKTKEPIKFNWTNNKRYYDFVDKDNKNIIGNKIIIEIVLDMGEVIGPIKKRKLDINTEETDKEDEKEEEKTTVRKPDIDITALAEDQVKLFNRYRDSKNKGLVFTLKDDDYNPLVNKNPDKLMGYNFQGYSSELYLYLTSLEKDDLLNIFDSLKEVIAINYNDVNMRMDGAGGMLRSGGRDILIDKIRYLSYLYREREKESNQESAIVKCEDLTFKDLFNNQDKLTQCLTKDKKTERAEEDKKLKDYNDNIKKLQEERQRTINEKLEQSNRKIEDTKIVLGLNKKMKELELKLSEIENDKKELEKKQNKIRESLLTNKSLIPNNFDDIFKKGKTKNKDFHSYMYNERYRGKPVKVKKDDNCASYCYTEVLLEHEKGFEYFITEYINNLYDINEGYREVDFFTCQFIYDKDLSVDDDNEDNSKDTSAPGDESVNINKKNILVNIRFYANVSGEEYNDNKAEESNFILIYRNNFVKKLSRKEDEYNKQLSYLKSEKSKLNLGKDDVDLKRILSKEKKLKELAKLELKNSRLSEWSFLKTTKEEMFIEEPIKKETKLNLLRHYAIQPDLVSLNTTTRDNTIEYKQLIEISDKNNYKYEYRIAIFPTGISLLDTEAKDFYGFDYKNNINSKIDNMPFLGLGEVYSDPCVLGDKIVNIEPEPVVIPPKIIKEKKTKIPRIDFFEPTDGTENTIVRIIGSNLDKFEYFSFRDIKVKILKKNKRKHTNDKGKIEILDEYMVKPPTLKELNKECWQSLEKYKVLVWGYYKGDSKTEGGLQIRSKKQLMYTYNDRKECPEDLRLPIPK